MKRDRGPSRSRTPKQTLRATKDDWENVFKAQIQAVKTDVGKRRTVRAAKVAKTRRLIADGHYRADSDAISERLMNALRDRVKASKR